MRWAAVLALVVACSVPRAQMTDQIERAPATAHLATPIQFGPLADPVPTYNAPSASAPSTPLRDGMFDALVALAKDRGDPRRDGRLDLVAGDLAELIHRGGKPIGDVVEMSLHERGVIEPINKLIVTATPTLDAIREELGNSLFFANVRVGIGGGGDEPLVVIVVHSALVAIEPIARQLPVTGEAELVATLDPRLHNPVVTVSHDDSHTAISHPAVWKSDRYAFRTTIECDHHVGTAWVLVEATDDLMVVQRLALFPITCGPPPEDHYRIEDRVPVADRDIVRRLTEIVNRERVAAGLAALRGDLRLDDAAHREVLLMQRSHSVDHSLGDSTTDRRMRDANLMAPSTFEATLHASDVASAAEILMNDRHYRAFVGHPEATHLGVAVAFDEHHELYVAFEMVQIVEPIDTAAFAKQILARINATREPAAQRRQSSPREPTAQLVLNERLTRLAGKYTRLRALGWSDESVTLALKGDGDLVFSGVTTVRRALSLLVDGDVAKVDLGEPYTFTDGLGIGVAQSPRNGALAGRIWVIIIYGHRN